MSNSPKLRGGSVSELTKLKAKWRELPDDTREFWRSRFASTDTQAAIRSELLKKLSINLRFDNQLTAFRQWVLKQDLLDTEAEQQIEDEQRLRAEFGESWTLDQIREEVLKRSYARALADGDFAAGRKTIVQHLNVEKVAIDKAKLVLLEKKAAQLEQVKEVVASKLTPEEQRQRLKEILA